MSESTNKATDARSASEKEYVVVASVNTSKRSDEVVFALSKGILDPEFFRWRTIGEREDRTVKLLSSMLRVVNGMREPARPSIPDARDSPSVRSAYTILSTIQGDAAPSKVVMSVTPYMIAKGIEAGQNGGVLSPPNVVVENIFIAMLRNAAVRIERPCDARDSLVEAMRNDLLAAIEERDQAISQRNSGRGVNDRLRDRILTLGETIRTLTVQREAAILSNDGFLSAVRGRDEKIARLTEERDTVLAAHTCSDRVVKEQTETIRYLTIGRDGALADNGRLTETIQRLTDERDAAREAMARRLSYLQHQVRVIQCLTAERDEARRYLKMAEVSDGRTVIGYQTVNGFAPVTKPRLSAGWEHLPDVAALHTGDRVALSETFVEEHKESRVSGVTSALQRAAFTGLRGTVAIWGKAGDTHAYVRWDGGNSAGALAVTNLRHAPMEDK